MNIASFNVKNLGLKKVTDKTVIRYLTEIISQYSVIVILEVVDKTGKAMEKLLQELNSNRKCPYSKVASRPLGRDTYKEKFVCFYREDEVTLKDSYQYEDNQAGDEDAFAREPFILRFSCPATAVKDFVLIPVHTKPEDSLKELDELDDVVTAVKKRWRTDKIIILGDFNADGRYLSKKKKGKIRIHSAPYEWLIDEDVDTTASNKNDNTYDRIVVYGQAMLKGIVPGSAKAFNFQKKFNLTDKETLSISDHYPVEVELKAARRNKMAAKKKGTEAKKARSAEAQKKKTTLKRKRGPSPDASPKKRRLAQKDLSSAKKCN